MALTSKDFGVVQLGTGFTSLGYTVPAAKKAIIRSLQLTNTQATGVTVSLCLVRSGGTPNAANALLWNVPLAGAASLQDDAVHILEAGGTIQALASVAGVVTLNAGGAEES